MKNLKKIICGISTILFLSANSISAFAEDYSSYDRVRAANYADRWAETPNSAFANYADEGGDCTNFVSQALYAGGIPESSSWYYSGYSSRSASWILAPSFRSYFKDKVYNNSQQTVSNAVNSWNSVYSTLWTGDVVQYGPSNGTITHSQIITGYNSSSKSTFFDQHSTTKSGFYKDGNLRNYLNGRPGSDKFYMYSIKNGF